MRSWEKLHRHLKQPVNNFILICTNTMHKVAPQIASMIKVPIIHIADATADELDKARIKRVGLLGTKYT